MVHTLNHINIDNAQFVVNSITYPANWVSNASQPDIDALGIITLTEVYPVLTQSQTYTTNYVDDYVELTRTYGVIAIPPTISGSGPVSYDQTTKLISVSTASPTTDGCLSHIDYNTFAGKQNALSGTGFVKTIAGVISYDTNTYLTSISGGDYTSLSNKPSIPAAQINTDWNSISGLSQLLNKPSLSTVATSGSYTDLSNKPSLTALGTITAGVWNGTAIDSTYLNIGMASIVAASSAINSTETVIIKTPALAASRLVAGTVIKITLLGTCTSSVANASTFSVRLGTNGTTADGLMLQGVSSVAATSGTSIPFRVVIELTVRTVGSSATCHGFCTLMNTGVTGISAINSQVILPTFTAFNTTTASNILSVTYKSAASTTTSTFQDAFIEIIYK